MSVLASLLTADQLATLDERELHLVSGLIQREIITSPVIQKALKQHVAAFVKQAEVARKSRLDVKS